MTYELLTKEELKKIGPFVDSMTEEEVAQYAYSRGFYDIEFFADYCLEGYSFLYQEEKLPVPKHIKEIWGILSNREDFNLIEPRGHNKTTGILIWILHRICYKLEKAILYISSENLGEIGIGKIRGELETNETLIFLYGDLVPKNSDDIKDKRLKKRRQKELEFTNGAVLKTMTKGQPVRGQRPTCVILDDPQENKDVESKKIVDKFNNWVFTSLYGTLLPGGFMVVVGTVIGNLCLVKHLKEEAGRKTIIREACNDNFENLLRPEMRSKASLIARKATIGTPRFNQEYRNIPLSKEDVVILEEYLRRYDVDSETPKKFDKIILAIDPIKKASEKSDDLGIVVAGIVGVNVYILFSKGIKLSGNKAEKFIQMVVQKYKPTIILKEDNIEVGMTENLEKLLKRKIRSVISKNDKFTRLLGVEPNFERGEIHLRMRNGEKQDDKLARQLTNFPDVDHDDVLDALVFILMYIAKKKGSGQRI